MLHSRIFQHYAARTQLQRLQHLPLINEPGQYDSARIQIPGRHLAQGFHARDIRHRQVQQ